MSVPSWDKKVCFSQLVEIYLHRPFRTAHLLPTNDRIAGQIVFDAKSKGKSGVLIFGGGSPKNFILQTEPQIQEVLGLEEKGHDYFVQFTDARPDTGGLSGATPQEAMTWGKVDESQLPDTVTAYVDSTIAMPLLSLYALQSCKPRKLRRLMDQLPEMTEKIASIYLSNRNKD